MKPEDDLKSLWDEAKKHGLTLAKAAELCKAQWLGKWGTSTVRDAYLGDGGEGRANQLRVTLKSYLAAAVTANPARAESVTPGVELHDTAPEYNSVSEYQLRIKQLELRNQELALHNRELEKEIAQLRKALLAFLDPDVKSGAVAEILKKIVSGSGSGPKSGAPPGTTKDMARTLTASNFNK